MRTHLQILIYICIYMIVNIYTHLRIRVHKTIDAQEFQKRFPIYTNTYTYKHSCTHAHKHAPEGSFNKRILGHKHIHAHTDLYHYSSCGGSVFQKRIPMYIRIWVYVYRYIYMCIYIKTNIHTQLTHTRTQPTNKHEFQKRTPIYINTCTYTYSCTIAHKHTAEWNIEKRSPIHIHIHAHTDIYHSSYCGGSEFHTTNAYIHTEIHIRIHWQPYDAWTQTLTYTQNQCIRAHSRSTDMNCKKKHSFLHILYMYRTYTLRDANTQSYIQIPARTEIHIYKHLHRLMLIDRIYTYITTCKYMYASIQLITRKYMHLHICIHVHTYATEKVYVYIHAHTFMYMYINTRPQTCTCTTMQVQMYTCLYAYIHIQAYIPT